MEFGIGYDLEMFKKYYRTLHDLKRFYESHGTREIADTFEIGEDELNHIKRDSNHLIIWKDNDTIVGHCIWHETSTSEMIAGDPRDDQDRDILQTLFNGVRENLVELHEVWLRTEFRRKGFGEQFFDFFEKFVAKLGFAGIVHYTDNPAGVKICRKRGYSEAVEPPELGGWYVFTKLL